MISYINGKILEVFEKEVLVETGGVGYLVMVGNRILGSVKNGSEVELFIYPHINRDGDVEFFGVANKEELNLFKKMISVSGVGPRMAMSILSGSTVKEILEAIEKERVDPFLKTSGVGRKTAQKIILDLKGQIQLGKQVTEDLYRALSSLGYSKGEVEKLAQGLDPNLPLEERVRMALKRR